MDREAVWGPGDNVLYFLSEREGFRCIWAQALDPRPNSPAARHSPYRTSTASTVRWAACPEQSRRSVSRRSPASWYSASAKYPATSGSNATNPVNWVGVPPGRGQGSPSQGAPFAPRGRRCLSPLFTCTTNQWRPRSALASLLPPTSFSCRTPMPPRHDPLHRPRIPRQLPEIIFHPLAIGKVRPGIPPMAHHHKVVRCTHANHLRPPVILQKPAVHGPGQSRNGWRSHSARVKQSVAPTFHPCPEKRTCGSPFSTAKKQSHATMLRSRFFVGRCASAVSRKRGW